MSESRERIVRLCYCPIHEIEFISSCPECLEKIREDYHALKQIPYRSKARRSGALYPAWKPRRVAS